MKNISYFTHILVAVVMAAMCSVVAYGFDERLDGTMMPYDFGKLDSVVPWTTDMKPVFVAYVARHGARYLSSEKKVSSLQSVLEKASKDGNITKKGIRFLALLDKVDSVTDRRWGQLNSEGIYEEQRLGEEMAKMFPDLLKSGKVYAEATYVPRVVMTMYEMCHSLVEKLPNIQVSTSEGPQFDPILRFFTTDSAYVSYLKHGPWKKDFDKFSEMNVPVDPAARMIKGIDDVKELQKITMESYGVVQSLKASGISVDVDEWFSEEEYEKCWEVDNLEHYYERSDNIYGNIPSRSAEPLLEDIMKSIKEGFEDISHPAMRMWFGHAETVIPLFAALKLPGCYAPEVCAPYVSSVWKDWNVSPLGANLMIVCLKDESGGKWISMRLNGKWLGITRYEEFKELLTGN